MSVSMPNLTTPTLRAAIGRPGLEPAHLVASRGAACGSCGSACPCARPCSDSDLNMDLMRHGEPVRLRRGEVIWEQGQPADALYVICTGATKLSRKWPDGREMILDLVFRGHMMGEEAAVAGAVHATTAVALAAGRAVRLEGAVLRKLLAADPALCQRLLNVAVERQANFARRLDELNHGAVESRLARVLLRIGEEVGLKDSRGVFVPVHLSRGDLADLVGCRVETTIRVMTRWQREGVVETQREGLVLREREVLEVAAREGIAA